jgi:hypothetical protein
MADLLYQGRTSGRRGRWTRLRGRQDRQQKATRPRWHLKLEKVGKSYGECLASQPVTFRITMVASSSCPLWPISPSLDFWEPVALELMRVPEGKWWFLMLFWTRIWYFDLFWPIFDVTQQQKPPNQEPIFEISTAPQIKTLPWLGGLED